MDRLFNNDIVNLGVWFNSHRAFAYGMSFLFPDSLAKRVHKSVDLSKIKRNEKTPYQTHSQVGKDHDDYPLHILAAESAKIMVKDMGQQMKKAIRRTIL